MGDNNDVMRLDYPVFHQSLIFYVHYKYCRYSLNYYEANF